VCVRDITIGGLDSVVNVRTALSEHLNVVVSINIVRRALHEACLGLLEKQKKLFMAKNVRCRLEFAQHHQYWTINDWYRVTFKDETKINQFQFDGCAWCWVRDGILQLHTHHASWIVKHAGGAIFVWGCMTSFCMGTCAR
jgi:hypothetical protein